MKTSLLVLFTAVLLLGSTAHPTARHGNSMRKGGEGRRRLRQSSCREELLDDDVEEDEVEDDQNPQLNVQPAEGAKAVYFITNDEENSVVALPVGEDGTLSEGTFTPTGGNGANGIDGKTQEPAVPDSLFSQGAITIAGNFIFAVNAGSNTLSMLAVDPENATNLELVGEPVDTLGQFPVSVAASLEKQIVCVANSGEAAGVACGTFDENGLQELDELRPFEINHSTPPVGPTNTVSHVFFNEDESILFTTVKGDPALNKTGFLSAFAVEDDAVGTEETRSSPPGTAVLFGSAIIPETGNILTTDASFGAAILSVNDEGKAKFENSLKIDGQVATCWAAISDVTGTGFVTDVGVNSLVELDVENGELIQQFDSENGNPGMTDLRAAGGFVYALSAGNAEVAPAVTVFSISGGPGTIEEVQNFQLEGVSPNAMGMAFI